MAQWFQNIGLWPSCILITKDTPKLWPWRLEFSRIKRGVLASVWFVLFSEAPHVVMGVALLEDLMGETLPWWGLVVPSED